ncbi:hypothetical protein AB0B15_38280 [Streptomyces sp. NPDC045456]|uniref:hypothetical protein n=1 Tax=Streptomyces sp. NPDC045456 TaxID=3155254 RepID=UPI0033E94F92
MKRTAAVLIATGVLALAGCSSEGKGNDGKAPADPTDAVLKVARSYQEAKNREDWRTVCGARTTRLRGGSVAECVKTNTPSSPTPEESSPSPDFTPPTYADGSTPQPRTRPSASGPDRADTGPVSASDVVEVAAVEDHPAGYGVLVTYTVKWPGKEATTTRHALRLVQEGGAWRVDQNEDIQKGDMGHGSPVRTALSGG